MMFRLNSSSEGRWKNGELAQVLLSYKREQLIIECDNSWMEFKGLGNSHLMGTWVPESRRDMMLLTRYKVSKSMIETENLPIEGINRSIRVLRRT